MNRRGNPTVFLLVWGDWGSVIDVREYRDVLLDQAPCDKAEVEDYDCYKIPCKNFKELFAAATAFHERARLRCAVGVDWTSEDKTVQVHATSDTGYSKSDSHIDVRIDFDENKLVSAISQAVGLLQEAVK